MKLPNDDLHVDAEVVRRSQDFNDAAHCAFAGPRIFQQFDVNDHAIQLVRVRDLDGLRANAVDLCSGGRNGQLVGDLDPVPQPLVVRNNIESSSPHAKLAYDGGVRALENLDDFAIRAPARLYSRDTHHHAIAVHAAVHRVGGEVDISGYAFEWPVRD